MEETNERTATLDEGAEAQETTEKQEGGTPVRRRRHRSRGRGRGRGQSSQPGGDAQAVRTEEGETTPRPTRPRPARRAAPTSAAAAEVSGEQGGTGDAEAPEPAGAGGGGDATTPAARRRRRRGGRGRSRAKASTPAGLEDAGELEEAPEPAEVASQPDEAGLEGSVQEQAKRPARRRRSPSRAKEAAGANGAEATVAEGSGPEKPASEKAGRAGGGKGAAKPKATTRTRTGRTRQRAPASEAADGQETAAKEEPADGGRPTRLRRARLPGRRRREAAPALRRVADKNMLITELGERDQIAVLEDRTLVEHFITRSGARSMVGNIFLGKVQNVLPGMEAAFIDVGRGRNAVLYAGEVSYDEEIDGETPRIEHVLKAGQNVLVQVTKDPMGGKGARLTQEISLPGRYLVLVPNSQVFGISRRLPDPERQRLKDILKRVRPPEHGLIVRTAAEGASEEDLEKDLERLRAEWAEIEKSKKRGKAPRVLYEEPELTVRVVRDMFNEGEFKEIVTDSPLLYERVRQYLESVAPELVSKVRMHTGPLPVLEAYHALEQIYKALDRKVWLPSGGYIVIDKTEAMTVVDVNTGKHVGKANLEETVTKTNTEAAEEIARQLRLRDIGGIIIIDFIDMLFERNRQKVIDMLKNELAQDKTRSQVFDIGPLGLLEVTRKRVSAGLLESFSETCPTCEGRGILLTHKP